MRTWEEYMNYMEESAMAECLCHRERMGLPLENVEDLECEEEACSSSCPMNRHPQDD